MSHTFSPFVRITLVFFAMDIFNNRIGVQRSIRKRSFFPSLAISNMPWNYEKRKREKQLPQLQFHLQFQLLCPLLFQLFFNALPLAPTAKASQQPLLPLPTTSFLSKPVTTLAPQVTKADLPPPSSQPLFVQKPPSRGRPRSCLSDAVKIRLDGWQWQSGG
mmetsp:Transcript_34479/g.47119  ORF Transcript_34479/g.47119 Transcript_34479/m.47119 type:complete len:161 (-) Transcript_34479:538-1020(-)